MPRIKPDNNGKKSSLYPLRFQLFILLSYINYGGPANLAILRKLSFSMKKYLIKVVFGA